MSDFSVKANLFNDFFASICTPIKISSVLPPLTHKTSKKLNSLRISEQDILLIIKALDSSKAYGYDNLSIKMIKFCEESITIPLKIIFEESLKCGVFPEIWKKTNVVPVHKKEDKTLVKNYRPISLLPIFSKIFERVIYNSIFNYFISNKLFTLSQSAFLPGDSCIAQLLSIIHEIQTAFDENPLADVGGIFLEISKAFDKVWHEGLLYKLKNGIESQLLSLLANYLENREQRVVLNGQTSEWKKIKSGVPQGSVLGPLLFLIYINDLPHGITSICKIFADDTSLFTKVLDINEFANKLNTDLKKITKWAHQWKMQFNPDPNKQANEVIFSKKSTNNLSYPPVRFNNNDIVKCPDQKHLGIVLDSKPNFDSHINQKIKKCNKLIGAIRRLSVHLPRGALLTI